MAVPVDAATRDEPSSGGEVRVCGVTPVQPAERAMYAHLSTEQVVAAAIALGNPPREIFVELGRRMERGAVSDEAAGAVLDAITLWASEPQVYVRVGRLIERGAIASDDGEEAQS
jgi:hypothetical protein